MPAHTYQFSWAPNPHWSKYYAPAPEILAYLNTVVDQHDLRKYMHFNHRAVGARWQEDTATWLVDVKKTDAQGQTEVITRECDVFIQGTGVLNNWAWPDIEGLHTFKGQLLHTASWDASADLRGKTIGVIGNAASAVQCVAALQPGMWHCTVLGGSPPHHQCILTKNRSPEAGQLRAHAGLDDAAHVFRRPGAEQLLVPPPSVSPLPSSRD